MSFGLTPEGFNTKRLADIKSEIEASLRSSLGASINLLPSSVLGQIVGILSEREASVWELLEAVYNSEFPLTAEGVNLDQVASITGITRQPGIKSSVAVLFEGDPTTLILAGSIFSVVGNPTARFVLLSDTTLDGAGEAEAILEAETEGPVSAPSGTLTVIENPVTGLDSVTNPLDAELGRNIESDSELKARRNTSLQRAGAGTLGALVSRLGDLDNVVAVIGFENITFLTLEGRPPKSFELVVQGGDDVEIAESIWENKPAGIEPFGSTSQAIVDSQGFPQTVKFSRPTAVPIYLEVDLTTGDDFPADGLDQVEAALLAFGNGLGIGKDVVVFPALVCAIGTVAGILDVAVRIGVAPGPTLDNNIVIAAAEISTWDSSRITVIEL